MQRTGYIKEFCNIYLHSGWGRHGSFIRVACTPITEIIVHFHHRQFALLGYASCPLQGHPPLTETFVESLVVPACNVTCSEDPGCRLTMGVAHDAVVEGPEQLVAVASG